MMPMLAAGSGADFVSRDQFELEERNCGEAAEFRAAQMIKLSRGKIKLFDAFRAWEDSQKLRRQMQLLCYSLFG